MPADGHSSGGRGRKGQGEGEGFDLELGRCVGMKMEMESGKAEQPLHPHSAFLQDAGRRCIVGVAGGVVVAVLVVGLS